jgi:mRNA-degrading endonuclease toxin of MazEF toxin-antitoxin module
MSLRRTEKKRIEEAFDSHAMPTIAFGGLAIVAAAALAAPLSLGLLPRIRLPAIVLGIGVGPQVLTRDEAIEQLGEVIVVPLTTTVRRLPNEVELDESDGMPRACVTSLDNLSTIAKGQLVEKITVVGPAKMDELCRALNATVAWLSI